MISAQKGVEKELQLEQANKTTKRPGYQLAQEGLRFARHGESQERIAAIIDQTCQVSTGQTLMIVLLWQKGPTVHRVHRQAENVFNATFETTTYYNNKP